MFGKKISSILLILFVRKLTAVYHPHEHSTIKIVGYDGPLDKHLFTLFKTADTIIFIGCNVTSASAGLYSRTPYLKKIIMINNTYSNVDHDKVCEESSLEEIYFEDNVVETISFKNLRKLPKLRRLTLKNLSNPVKNLGSHSLTGTSLEYLDFSGNGLETIDDNAFAGLDKLVDLNLSDNKLERLSKSTLEPLKKLETLSIEGNLISQFIFEELPILPNLKRIELKRNPLKTLSFNGLERVSPLVKYISVENTLLQVTDIKEIAKRFASENTPEQSALRKLE